MLVFISPMKITRLAICCERFWRKSESKNEKKYAIITVVWNRFFCSPDVAFVGYNVPHPLEKKMTVRIQTNGGVF